MPTAYVVLGVKNIIIKTRVCRTIKTKTKTSVYKLTQQWPYLIPLVLILGHSLRLSCILCCMF